MKKQFRDFESAREFVRTLNLKSGKEWNEYCKSGNKPDDIPSSQYTIYKNKGYVDLGDWLGARIIATTSRIFRPFKEAREFARALGLKNRSQWWAYCKSGNKPDDIPANPRDPYIKEWEGWLDFLCDVSSLDKQFRPFKEAREFARALNLKSGKWREYCKSGNKPDDIPANPNNIYKKEWHSFDDFLNLTPISSLDKQFRPFKEAREFARALNLKGYTEWREYCKSGNKPDDIPATPDQIYKNEGYVNSKNWLGAGMINSRHRSFRPFKEAREFARALNLKGYTEWREYCASGNKPDDIPATPSTSYKKDFKGMGDWLGTGNVANFNKQYRPYKEAREFARTLGLKNRTQWREYCKSGNNPDDIPSAPEQIYKKISKDWGIGWELETLQLQTEYIVHTKKQESLLEH